MQIPTLCFMTVAGIILFSWAEAQHPSYNTESRLYPYALKGFVDDVRHQPYRFIGSLFFKKAFILLKLKLKWKLKKKLILKKLLKKLFRHFHVRKRRGATFSFPRDDEQDTPQSTSEDGFLNLSPSQRRQYDEELARSFPNGQEPNDSAIMKYLAMASEFDTNGCIPKGICEVMARGNHTSNQFENNILDYYNDDPNERIESKGTPAYIYDYAANLGKSNAHNGRICASYFRNCADPPQQMNTYMNEVFVSEMCDAPVGNYS